VRLILLEDVAPQPWRNGGGQTRELLVWPEAGDWRLRISLADIRNDGPFSAFPGIIRWFTVVEGRGVVLRLGNHTETLGPGSAPLRFDGGSAPGCTLIDGPTRDLNLMLRDGEGVMEPVRPGQPWNGAFAQRGLFTTVAGKLQSGPSLPANSLVWEIGAGPLAFEPDEPAPVLVAWWLGYSPGPPDQIDSSADGP
jgi:environmental stress-induced protein Ves